MDGDGILETPNEILQEKHFYPFGMAMEGPWMESSANPVNKYQYNGKELHTEFGLNLMNYGARWYDAAVGRWWSVDLMADVLEEWSPYVYVYNNPISFNDPTGMIGELASTFVGPNGKVLEERDDGDSNVYFVSNPASWNRDKKGLSVIGLESQFRKTNDGGYEYNFGQQAIQGNYFIEALFIPLPFVSKLGGYVLRPLKIGGKWIIEVLEAGTNKIISKFIQQGTKTAGKTISEFQKMTSREISQYFQTQVINGKSQHQLINEFFKKNKGVVDDLHIPEGLSKETLKGYKVIIERVLNNAVKSTPKGIEVQTKRLNQIDKIIDKLK